MSLVELVSFSCPWEQVEQWAPMCLSKPESKTGTRIVCVVVLRTPFGAFFLYRWIPFVEFYLVKRLILNNTKINSNSFTHSLYWREDEEGMVRGSCRENVYMIEG